MNLPSSWLDRVYFLASLNLSNEGVFRLMLPTSLRQHPHFKREWKFLVSFSGYFFKFAPCINLRIRKFHIADVQSMPKSVLQEQSCCFAHKTNRFWRSRFLCRSGLTFHSWWDWAQVYSQNNNNNKTFTKGAILQCEHSFRFNTV